MANDKPSRRSLASDLRWGVAWGLALAVALTLLLAILFAVHGSQLFESYGTTFMTVAMLYLGGGVAGGLVVGLLRPLARWRAGAAVLGVLATVPIGLGVRLLREGLAPWATKDTFVVGILALALGGTMGWIYWGIFRDN